jgi:hypothetical protein
VPAVRKAEVKSLEMGSSDTGGSGSGGSGGASSSSSPAPAPAVTSKAATREVSYAKEKPSDKSGDKGDNKGAGGQPGKDC